MSYNLVNPTTGDLTRVAGRGRAEYGASAIRTGTINIPSTAAGAQGTVTITFSAAMPDTDYVIVINNGEGSIASPNEWYTWSITEKSASGFKIRYLNVDNTATSGVTKLTYTAFKLYSNIEINDLVNYGTRFPDYAHEITGISNPWTATQDVYAVVNIVSSGINFGFNIDGEDVLVKDISSGIGVCSFAGYIKKGSVIQWNGSLGSTVRIWPLK